VYWRVEGSLADLTTVRPVAFFTWNAQTFLERWVRRGLVLVMALLRPFLYAVHRIFATRVVHTVLRGISRFAAHRRDWSLRWRLARGESIRELTRWNPDGLIHVASEASPIQESHLSVRHCVVAGACWADGAGATVRCDLQAAGKLAFAHLQDHGYRQLACLASYTSQARELKLGFVRAAKEHGLDVDVKLLHGRGDDYEGHLDHNSGVADWIRELPRPSAMFVACDRMAANVCELIHDVGLSIPDDLSLVACGNDDVAALDPARHLRELRFVLLDIADATARPN
jgi:DNA-binding LacI/PurR family transcriptional regulator